MMVFFASISLPSLAAAAIFALRIRPVRHSGPACLQDTGQGSNMVQRPGLAITLPKSRETPPAGHTTNRQFHLLLDCGEAGRAAGCSSALAPR
ncbi:hypothetical protein LX36DRAFT_658592 [Colletotrichum falcatum]|nr:hypothetical protein LX36DRAFT_658592 [Colletotrichum falcatum]